MKKLNIHFVGIKGVGMTPLAIIAKEAGFGVSGSDIEQEFITDEMLVNAQIDIRVGFNKQNIQDQDLVVVTGAHGGFKNIEAIEARQKGIRVISQGEAVGIFMQGDIVGKRFIGISVAGTHGKTTTSSMIATILQHCGLDPSFVIGSGYVSSLGSSGHLGKGQHFIAEADEYSTDPNGDRKSKFLWQIPKIAVLTNIEYDHPDIYNSIDEVVSAYAQFANQMDKTSTIVACGDDLNIRKISEILKPGIVTYGYDRSCDYVIEKLNISGDHMFMTVSSRGMIISDFMLNVIGEHNGLNALASIIVCLEQGVSIAKIKSGIASYAGSKRRFEFIGELRTGAVVYDDYAHHPTEIKKTLNALKMRYPKKNLIAVFQPHMYSRTKKLFDEFIGSFYDADIVVITKIYSSSRENPDPQISALMMVDELKSRQKNVIYLENNKDVVEYVNKNRFRSDTVIITMGAGDIYKIHTSLTFTKF